MQEASLSGVPHLPLAYLEILLGHQWSWGPGYEAVPREGAELCEKVLLFMAAQVLGCGL